MTQCAHHILPIVKDAPLDFDVRYDASLSPDLYCSGGFIEAVGQFSLGKIWLVWASAGLIQQVWVCLRFFVSI